MLEIDEHFTSHQMLQTTEMWMEKMIQEANRTEIILCCIACLVSLSLFVAYPWPIFWKLLNNKPIESFHAYSLWMFPIYNMLFLAYVFSLDYYPLHYWCLYTTSAICLMVEDICIFILFSHTERFKPMLLTSIVFIMSFLIPYTLVLNGYDISSYLGLVATVCGVGMYASPFMLIGRIDTGKVVRYDLHGMCYGCLSNIMAWSLVGFVSSFDIYITVTNLSGVMLGCLYLVVIHLEYIEFLHESSDCWVLTVLLSLLMGVVACLAFFVVVFGIVIGSVVVLVYLVGREICNLRKRII